MFGLLWKLRSVFFFEADKGGGAQTDTSSGNADDAGKAKKEEAVAESEDSRSGDDAKGKKKKIEWTAEQQAEIDRINKETRLEERKKAQAELEEKTAKAKKDAEEKELTEKQEFKTLAEKRLTEIETLKGEITTLTDAKEQGEKYKAALEAHLKAQTEKLPAHIKTLLSKLDVLEQMEYLTKNAKDLGVKLDSIDATPPENTQSESELEASQSKELRQKVRAWT